MVQSVVDGGECLVQKGLLKTGMGGATPEGKERQLRSLGYFNME